MRLEKYKKDRGFRQKLFEVSFFSCTAINEEATQYCGHGGLYTFNENPLFEKKLKAGAEEFKLETVPTVGWTKEDVSGNYALDA